MKWTCGQPGISRYPSTPSGLLIAVSSGVALALDGHYRAVRLRGTRSAFRAWMPWSHPSRRLTRTRCSQREHVLQGLAAGMYAKLTRKAVRQQVTSVNH